jgi:hypothetical protein
MTIVLNGPLGIGNLTRTCGGLNVGNARARSTNASSSCAPVAEEREVLTKRSDVGEPFDVSAPPPKLVARMLRHLALG